MTDRVTLDIADGIATVGLNRPEKHNALDIALIQALVEAARTIRADRSVRAVVLQGNGPSFCSGLDVASAFSSLPKFFKHFATFGVKKRNIFQDVSLCWRDLQVPVIAAIHGNCFGGGLQIALGADIRIATPESKLSVMEVKWGLIPDMSGTVLLRELMPIDVAKELTLTGRVVAGTEAQALGLVTRLAADPKAEALALAREIAAKSPDAVAAGKQLLNANWLCSENKALGLERKFQLRMFRTKNQRIAVKAGLARQLPEFKPRQGDY
ncbi:crotonase/enoyl-CoA hydratase family protein [Solimonas sp. K1W22B-7]|uniref:crotonase/enoyl-CoA hydratase family protein n=1 Tax=Solimonas sp. K1W22B-7 TaxID=2303331 RepID=UPI000E336B51|nr:crotonase/enoyl-CoA hydratase family protein [Solimonas sp. K1W22B-7]AXQ31787.1 crotonase/enoyl-CoA hydratase family protein [Solimonas sp. K1W22B-7]